MTEASRTWRPRQLGRAVAWVYIVGFLATVVAVAIVMVPNGEFGIVLGTAISGTPLLPVAWLGGLRPFIRADAQGLQIQNPLSRYDLTWRDIAEVTPGYYGLEIATREHGVVFAWAVQKSNASRWVKMRTRADDVADCIRRYAEHGFEGPTAK
jgi:hypothetical protein